MKNTSRGAQLALAAMSFLAAAAPASAGTKTIVNDTDSSIKVSAITRCQSDPSCTAGIVYLEVKRGGSQRLDYPTTYLNQFIVDGADEHCAVTVNTRGDSGDNTMNTNSVLTVSELGAAHTPLADVCAVKGSN
jgi:hypothetical protein